MQKKQHILILIPVYKRPEITRICVEGLKNLILQSKIFRFSVVFLLSKEDQHFQENLNLIPPNCKAISFPNFPVGTKMNAGIKYIMSKFKFDYLMNFGSDNIIHPQLMYIYKPYIDAKKPMFGLTNIYFHNFSTEETIFMELFDKNIPYGLARMIHYDVLNYLYQKNINLYPEKLNSGLDSNSFRTMYQNVPNFSHDIIMTSDLELTIDIKTNTNINHWLSITKINHPSTKQVNLKSKCPYFYEIIKKFK